MTITELIDQLKAYPGDMRIIKSKDDEGNAYHEVWKVEEAFAATYSLDDYYVEVCHPDDVDEYDDTTKVLVIT